MNKRILKNTREDFILKYRAAIKSKISKEQLAEYLDMQPKSLMRRRLELKDVYGLDLPYLHSDKSSFDNVADQYFEVLESLSEKILKIESVNDIETKTKIDIQKNKTYIITSAQNATPIHHDFFKSLVKYTEYNHAQLIVIPYRYKNPTSVWSIHDKSDDWWDTNIKPYLLTEELKVSDHLRIMGHIKIQPTAVSPLSGFDTIADMDSAIFGHPRVEWKTVPSVIGKMPKILATTGSITQQNYSDSKIGHKGALHHKFGAAIVQVDEDGFFHIRHIEADKSGSFQDLDKIYTKNYVIENQTVLALYAGDTHAEVADDTVKQVTYLNKDSIAETLKPSYMIFGDLFDAQQRSHHVRKNEIGQFVKHFFDEGDNVEEGLQQAVDYLDDVSKPFAENVVLASNHIDHLSRWLNEADPKIDPENARLYYYLKYHQYVYAQNKKHFEPLQFWSEYPDQYEGMKNDQTLFLSRNQSFELANVELSLHGDVGSNGAKGSSIGFSKLGQKIIVGHSHTPSIVGNAYTVGTSSRFDLSYVKGPSSWLHTHAILYPSGAITLINIINGKWKL